MLSENTIMTNSTIFSNFG